MGLLDLSEYPVAGRGVPLRPQTTNYREARALWKCPRCGAKLVSRNLAHSCGDYSIEKFLAGKSEAGRMLFQKFVALIGKCGPYETAPAKTRVAFLSKVRFASVNRVNDDTIDVHFVLPRALKGRRFRRVEQLGKLYVHHLRLGRAEDFNDELLEWLRASYVEYGERAWLKPKGRRDVSEAGKPRTAG